MRFLNKTTPFPQFFDKKGQLLNINVLLSDTQKEELLTWVRHNVTPDHAPPPKLPGKSALKTPCWNWNGAVDRNTNAARYLNHAAHAFIYRMLNGLNNTPPHLLGRIAHLCRNPRCVNPDHCQVQTGRRTLARKQILQTLNPDDPNGVSTDTITLLKPVLQKILEQQEVILKNLKLLAHTVQHNQANQTNQASQSQKLASDLADAVVAELIRVKFDQLVAKAVSTDNDRGVTVRRWE